MTLISSAAHYEKLVPPGPAIKRILRKILRTAFIFSRFLRRFVLMENGVLLPETARAILEAADPNPAASSVISRRAVKCESDLAVIVAAFNAEKYIKECIDSITSQKTKYDVKIVVVNDGSTDGTGRILQSYAEAGAIQLINQENRGLSEARNSALSVAFARYVMFVDADDILAENALEVLLNAGMNNNGEIVTGSYYRFSSQVITELHVAIDCIYSEVLGNTPGFACMKLIQTSLLSDVRFPPGYWYEDTMLSYLVFSRCQNAVSISPIVYGYRVNPDSITAQTVRSKRCIDSYWIFEQLQRDMEALGIEPDQSIYELCVEHVALTCRRVKRESCLVKRSVFRLARDEIEKKYDGFRTKKGFAHALVELGLRRGNFALYELASEFVRLGDRRPRVTAMSDGTPSVAAAANVGTASRT